MLLCSCGLKENKNLHYFFPVAETEVTATSHNCVYATFWVNPRCYKDIFMLRTIKIEFLTWLDGGITRWCAGMSLNDQAMGLKVNFCAPLQRLRHSQSLLRGINSTFVPITTPSHSDVHFPELSGFLFGLGWRRGAYEIDRRWALISDWSVEQ